MAKSIQIPGLLRLVLAKEPSEVTAANAAPGVDRTLSGGGGLLNRMIVGKLRPFRTGGKAWPAFSSRDDSLRAKQQSELEERLSHVEQHLSRLSGEIAELAAFVRGGSAARPVGVVVQQATGRLFFDDYQATDESYGAAAKLSEWLAAGPVKTLRLRLAGEPQAATDKITRHARGDLACAHATGLALHNIVESMTLMQELARSGELKRLPPSEAVARTMRAPRRVLREAQDAGQVGNVRWTQGSLLVFAVEDARKRSSDPGVTFFSGQWNRCPAHAVVPALMAEVWRVASA